MASSWKIIRGKTTNRVRRKRREDLRGKQKRSGKKVGPLDRSPQRGKIRTMHGGELDVWTTISLTVRVEDLIKIDARADELEMSRSRFVVEAALIAGGHVPDWLIREWRES